MLRVFRTLYDQIGDDESGGQKKILILREMNLLGGKIFLPISSHNTLINEDSLFLVI